MLARLILCLLAAPLVGCAVMLPRDATVMYSRQTNLLTGKDDRATLGVAARWDLGGARRGDGTN